MLLKLIHIIYFIINSYLIAFFFAIIWTLITLYVHIIKYRLSKLISLKSFLADLSISLFLICWGFKMIPYYRFNYINIHHIMETSAMLFLWMFLTFRKHSLIFHKI